MEFEMQPLSDLDNLVNSAKGIINKYAIMGDKNFSMLNDVLNGTKTMAEVRFVTDGEQELTTDEKKVMQTVMDKLVECGRDGHDSFSAFQESMIISKGPKSNGGKKRSNKHSKKRSNKNRGRRTTSHRRRSRARV